MNKGIKGLFLTISVLLLFSLVFVSCTKDNNTKTTTTTNSTTTSTTTTNSSTTSTTNTTDNARVIFAKTEYEIKVGETYSLNPTKEGNISSLEYNVENSSIITCNQNGVITALKEGTSSLVVIVNNNQNTKITLTIIVKPALEVGNIEENRTIYNNLLSEISHFSTKIDNSNYLTLTIKTNTNGEISTQTMKAINEPIYLEVTDNSNPYPTILQEENGKIFEYTFNSSTNLNRRFVQDIEDFNSDSEYEFDIETLFSITFNPEKGNAKKVENNYTFKSYYKDALDEASKEMIEELYQQLGISTSKLYDSIVVINYVITDERLLITNTLNLELELYGTNIEIDMVISYDLSIKEFTKIDLNHPKYTISKPENFDEVMDITDLSEPYILNSYSTDYLKVNLEKGQYYIKDGGNNYSNFIIEIYDLDLNKIDSSLNITSSYINEIGFTFVVPETKEYYVKLKNYISVNRTLTFNKLDYVTIFDINNPKEFTNSTGFIEGKWDYEYYVYNASEMGILKVTNTGDNRLFFICNQYGGQYQSHSLEPNNYIYVKVTQGVNKFYISGYNDAYDYSFSVEKIDNTNGTETDFDKMDLITEDYSEKLYMAGYGLNDKYMKLIVTQEGLFTFQFECIEPIMSLQVSIMKRSGEIVSSYGISSFILVPGEYIVKITNNDHIFGIGKIKYSYIDTKDKDVEIELPYGNLSNINTSEFTNLKSQKVVTSQVIKYYFSLTEAATIVYDEDNMIIYDSEGNRLSLTPTYYAHQDYGLIELDAGRYYFMTPDMYGGTDYFLKIAIVEQTRDTKQDLDNLTELVINEAFNINKDWKYDKEYFQINIVEDGKYRLSAGRYYLFDENLNSIYTEYINGGQKFDAKIGTYYVIYIYDDNQTNYSITLIKEY